MRIDISFDYIDKILKNKEKTKKTENTLKDRDIASAFDFNLCNC